MLTPEGTRKEPLSESKRRKEVGLRRVRWPEGADGEDGAGKASRVGGRMIRAGKWRWAPRSGWSSAVSPSGVTNSRAG